MLAYDPLGRLSRTVGGAIDGGTRRFLMADERGSIVSVSDSAGTAIAINAYDDYGIPAPGNVGRFGYTGQTWVPELGMWYYKARMYSPTLGRFMQTDPIGYADGLNWYNYVGSDPVNRTDPFGLKMVYSCVTVGGGASTCGWSDDGSGPGLRPGDVRPEHPPMTAPLEPPSEGREPERKENPGVDDETICTGAVIAAVSTISPELYHALRNPIGEVVGETLRTSRSDKGVFVFLGAWAASVWIDINTNKSLSRAIGVCPKK